MPAATVEALDRARELLSGASTCSYRWRDRPTCQGRSDVWIDGQGWCSFHARSQIRDAVERGAIVETIALRWNDRTREYDATYAVTLTRPDQYGKRGGPICAVCGSRTASVLDGEAWCSTCGGYQ